MKEFSKKSFLQKSLAMLFAMFMLGACSTVGDDSSSSSSTSTSTDKTMDEALGELDVDTTGMTHWRITGSEEEDGVSYTSTMDYYFGADTYAVVAYAEVTEGSYWYWFTMAESGDLEIITDYTLEVYTDGSTTISDKDGYVVYAFTQKDYYEEFDTNHPDYVNENGGVSYRLVKISGSTMYTISGGYFYDESSKTFTLTDSLADANVLTFTKQ